MISFLTSSPMSFNCFNCYGYYVTVASCLTSRFTSLRSFLENLTSLRGLLGLCQSQVFIGCLSVSDLSWVFASLRSVFGVCQSQVFIGCLSFSGLSGRSHHQAFLGLTSVGFFSGADSLRSFFANSQSQIVDVDQSQDCTWVSARRIWRAG
jgi:hypothetical protein